MASTNTFSVWRLLGARWSRKLWITSSLLGCSATVAHAAQAKEPNQTDKPLGSLALRPETGRSASAGNAAGTTPTLFDRTGASDQKRIQPATLQKALTLIRQEQPQLEVSLDAAHLDSHARDVSFHEPHSPDAVIYPRSAEEVATILRHATEFGIPVVPYAAATSLEGHVVPRYGGLSVDCSHMDHILAVRPADMDCDVEPGVGWETLNEHLRQYGLFFAPDPGPGACIGGMIGTSCSGTNAARYGTMRENVLSLEVVLPTGAIIRQTRSRARKSSAGYDLTRLFVGSEGTLGIVTKATLRLRPLPAYKGVVKCTFDRIEDAAATVEMVLGPAAAVSIGRCELLDRLAIQAVNRSTNNELRLDESRHLLLFELIGESLDVIREQAIRVRSCAEQHGLHEWRMAAAPHVLELPPSTAGSPNRREAVSKQLANEQREDAGPHPESDENPRSGSGSVRNWNVSQSSQNSEGKSMKKEAGVTDVGSPSSALETESLAHRNLKESAKRQVPTNKMPVLEPDTAIADAAGEGTARMNRVQSHEDQSRNLTAPPLSTNEMPPTSMPIAAMDTTEQQLWREREELWRARKVAYWAAYELRPGAEIWTTDVAVPLSKLADVLRETLDDIEETNRVWKARYAALPALLAPLVAHAADGNFHLLMLVDPNEPAEMERARQVNDRLVHRAITAGGTCTGEHGIGEGKRRYLVTELGPEAVALMRRIKAAIDPAGIMNPGKVLPDLDDHETEQ